jgi:signal transduction histidine kinase
VPQGGIGALAQFARVVSNIREPREVVDLLGAALTKHVAPDGLAVYTLAGDGRLHLAFERGVAGAPPTVELDDVATLGELLRAISQAEAQTTRPLVAGASLYGSVVMVHRGPLDERALALADGFIDLAAIALGTAAHVRQLERQFEELREQQEMLARTEKLRALGQMAAGISHDLKNILNPLSLHIQVIVRAVDRGKPEDAKASAIEMKQVVARGLQTLERLRDFSRQSKETKPELVELDRLAREATAIGKSRATSGGGRLPRVVEELTAPPAVSAVSGEILSALVNLVVNAIDAFREGGDTITLRSGESDAGSWIEVADNGPGMPPEVAQRVFEPFFTTKGSDGTGLGLAMVYATMQRHGGSVTVASERGKGTTFRLTLPAAGPSSISRL